MRYTSAKMDSQIKLIFVCFIINVCRNVSNVDANLLDSVIYDDSEISDLSSKDKFNLHHAFVIEDKKWKDGRVSFTIDESFDDNEIDNIKTAMHKIERSSCIRFSAHDPRNGTDYVRIKKSDDIDGDDRFASTSKIGCLRQGEQLIEIRSDHTNTVCIALYQEHRIILHALLNTIGFSYHQQRSDRDRYIEIHLKNLNSSDSSELIIFRNYAKFVKFDPSVQYLTPFDFNSILLYNAHDLSFNGKPVITSKIDGTRMTTAKENNKSLSEYDKVLLNRFYDC